MTMKTILPVALVASALAVGGWWLWSQRGDRYDYAAEFEDLPAAEASADWRLADFAGQPRDVAEQALGRPFNCELALHSTRCRYAAGVEVVYIDQRADWITIRFPYGRHPLDAAALERLGLPSTPPSAEDESSLRWNALPGLHEVQIVGDENGVRFARIKVRHG